jgi:hypothetical protein
MTWEKSGALGGTRTPNLLIRSQMLYPLSYERRFCCPGVRFFQVPDTISRSNVMRSR